MINNKIWICACWIFHTVGMFDFEALEQAERRLAHNPEIEKPSRDLSLSDMTPVIGSSSSKLSLGDNYFEVLKLPKYLSAELENVAGTINAICSNRQMVPDEIEKRCYEINQACFDTMPLTLDIPIEIGTNMFQLPFKQAVFCASFLYSSNDNGKHFPISLFLNVLYDLIYEAEKSQAAQKTKHSLLCILLAPIQVSRQWKVEVHKLMAQYLLIAKNEQLTKIFKEYFANDYEVYVQNNKKIRAI